MIGNTVVTQTDYSMLDMWGRGWNINIFIKNEIHCFYLSLTAKLELVNGLWYSNPFA